jgi:subtilisin family serine protease
MMAGRKSILAVAAATATVALLAVAVTTVHRGSSPGHQSAREVAGISRRLPEGVTPLDPAHPNPTGDDPSVVGTPPEIPRAFSEDDILGRQAQRRAAGQQAAAATLGKPGDGLGPGASGEPRPRADDDSLLVTYADGASAGAVVASLARAGLQAQPIKGTNVVEVEAGGQDLGKLTTQLQRVDGVEGVEPNLIRSIDKVPNDPGFAAQSPSFTTAHVPAAWDVAVTGATTTVAVLDTGVDLDHPDLAPNLVAGFDEVNQDSSPADDNGHGTEVAGLIGAATNNGSAMSGVAWNARVMPVKVLGADGTGSDADLARGIVWATDHGAKVINMSLGRPGASNLLDQAVLYALSHEVVLVGSAGNDSSTELNYPGGAPGVIGVTATDADGRFAWFSNHGPWYFLAAPGVDVPTTKLAPGPVADTTTATGTSFSSPIVAGVAALLKERHPAWGWFEVLSDLVRTGRDAGPAGVDDAYQFGIVDAAAALGVNPLGATSQPDLTGDAGNVRAAARAITPGTPASETLGYEYDEDWFGFDVASPSGATVTVTPPAALPPPNIRAAELDPMVELYGPGGGLVAQADEGVIGEAETLTVNLAAGHHTVRVRNFTAAAGPGPYTVIVTLGAMFPATGFQPAETLAAFGAWESSTAVADFDGDGRDDVVLGTGSYFDEPNDFKLFLLTQGPDGTLGAPRKLPTHATYPGDSDPLRAADLDGDGDIDLARGTASGLDVAWNDHGVLADPVLYAGVGAVAGIQTADLDGAGGEELVVQVADQLAVVRWTGTTMAVAPAGITAATSSITGISYAVGDVTADGRPDIVTLDGDHATVHAQQPGGTWAAPSPVALPGFAGCSFNCDAALGDVTGDGRADLAAAGTDFDTGTHIVVRPQLPGGGFAAPQTLTSFDSVAAMRTADVTGDQRDDLVVMRNGGGFVTLYRQTASGALGPPEEIGGMYATWEYSPDSLAVGDIDGDGLNEPVGASYNGGLFVIRHQATTAAAEGAGPWVQTTSPAAHATGVARSVHPVITFGRDVTAASVGPVDGTGAETVALEDGRDGAFVDITTSVSGRTLTITPATPLTAGAPYQVVLRGITSPQAPGDVSDVTIPFTVAPGPKPSFSISGTYIPVVLDIDGNGFDDILWYAPGSAADSLWLFTPDGRVTVPASVGGTYTPIVGDFDGNGYQDIFWYGPGSGADVMWANGRDGIVSRSLPVGGVYKPVAGDDDRNGFDDIFWYAPGTPADSLWRFNATGHTSVAQTVNGSTYRPAAGDYTRDGFDDIVWYAPGTAVERLWKGGAAPFAKGPSMAINATYSPRTMDFNADGFDELFLSATNRSIFLKSGPSGFFASQPGPAVPSTVRPATGDFTGDIREDLLAYVPGAAADPFYLGTPTGVS